MAYDLHGKYTTDIITEEAIRVIKNHHDEQTANRTMGPLFLYVAHAAVHSGNPYNPLPAPDPIVSKMNHIDDFNRRKYAGKLMNEIQLNAYGMAAMKFVFCLL